MNGTTVGVLGSSWRGVVTPWGGLTLPDGTLLDWWVAADDRWHTPSAEPTLRQHCLDGAPVVETRLRVPKGDVVQRVYAVADGGGFTVLEFENDSPLPVAVALSTRAVRTARPPSDTVPQGIDLPAGAGVHPLGHRAVLRVAVAHDGSGPGPLPELPGALQVARGWSRQLERGGRLVLPDTALTDRVAAARSSLLLEGLDDPEDDPVAFLLGAHELARAGAPAAPWMAELAGAAEQVARRAAVSGMGWDADRALLAAGDLFARNGERRALGDLADTRVRLGGRSGVALAPPDGIRVVAWVEDRLARPVGADETVLLPDGVPEAWRGAGIEGYRLPAGPGRSVSYAVRWHGERPAVLWEVEGPSGLMLRAGGADQAWRSSEPAGETLLRPL